MPTPWMAIRNSEGGGGGGSQRPKFLKESMKSNWNFWRGGGVQSKKKKTSMGEVWIFSGTYHTIIIKSYFVIVPN